MPKRLIVVAAVMITSGIGQLLMPTVAHSFGYADSDGRYWHFIEPPRYWLENPRPTKINIKKLPRADAYSVCELQTKLDEQFGCAVVYPWAGSAAQDIPRKTSSPALTVTQKLDSWEAYVNARFCYALDVPASFEVTLQPDNGDGQRMESGDGGTELSIWGAFILDGDFSTEIGQRIRWAEEDGWRVTYRRVAEKWASFSGEKGDRFFYTRAIQVPSGAAAFAQIEYPRSDQQAVEPIIEKLVDSLHPTGECRVN